MAAEGSPLSAPRAEFFRAITRTSGGISSYRSRRACRSVTHYPSNNDGFRILRCRRRDPRPVRFHPRRRRAAHGGRPHSRGRSVATRAPRRRRARVAVAPGNRREGRKKGPPEQRLRHPRPRRSRARLAAAARRRLARTIDLAARRPAPPGYLGRHRAQESCILQPSPQDDRHLVGRLRHGLHPGDLRPGAHGRALDQRHHRQAGRSWLPGVLARRAPRDRLPRPRPPDRQALRSRPQDGPLQVRVARGTTA